MPTPNIIEIDSTTGFAGISYSNLGPNQDLGPWYIGSKRYVGYMRSLPQVSSPDLLYTAIASSVDGVTFTCHDQADAPGIRPLNLGPAGAVCLGNDGTTLYTAYADPSNNISIIPFDTGTDLYGAILSGGPAVTSHVMISSLRMLSTGVMVVVYGVDTGAFGALQIVTCTTGGVWGSPVTIVTDVNPVNNFCMSNVPDSAGNAHILAMAWNGSTHAVSLDYYIVNGASVTGPTSILTGGTNTLSPYANTCGTGYYDATNDRVLFPYLYNTGGVGGVGIIRVDAASTSPVATIDNVGAMYNLNYGYPGITADPGNTTYIFTYQNFTITEQLFRWTRPANAHISWAMTVWWNYNTDPPTPDPSSPGHPAIEENPSSGLKPLGTTGFGTLVSFFGGGGSSAMQYHNTLYYMELVSPSLRLIKSVSGGTALPTQWLLTATGPTTVSGAGDTGVVEVAAGTYALTESPGADGYTAGAWNCGGAVMPTATSVVVPDGGTDSVGIIWLQDDSRVSGQVGAFINVRASAGVWNRTLLYDYVANPPSGVDPSATALTNLTAALTSNSSFTDIGTIFGVTGLLSVPHQNYPVAFAELGGTPATELDGTNKSCVDFSYTSGAVPQGAWLIAGVWWSVMQLPAAFQGDGLDHIRVYKSTDFVTWTGVDTANEIVQKAAAWYFDGANTIYFCYKDANTNQTTQIEFTISGSTGSWGSPHGAALLSTFVYSLVYSPTGPTWHGLFLDVSNQPVYGYSDGTTWTFPSITLLQGNWTSKASYILLDPNNTTVHIVCGDYYNQVTTGGVLALTTHLSAIVPGASMTFGGRGVINGGSLFFPTTSNSTGELYCLVSSGPLSAPTFAAELVDDAFHSDAGVAEESVALIITGSSPGVVCTITNTFGSVAFTATCPSPIIILGVPYSSFVTVTGGTPPYTFAVHSGSLPTGLSLNASTGEISGTPSAAGPFTFTIRVTDSLAATADTPNCPAGRCTGTVSII